MDSPQYKKTSSQWKRTHWDSMNNIESKINGLNRKMKKSELDKKIDYLISKREDDNGKDC